MVLPPVVRTLFYSLRRRALRLYSFPSGAGRSLRSQARPRARGRATLRAFGPAGAVAPAGPLRGPVHVSSDTPFAAGRLREMNKPAPLASGLGATL